MDPKVLILLIVVIAAVAIGIFLLIRKRRSETLRRRFGPEYERALRDAGDRSRAEAELAKRQKRVEKLPLRLLLPEQHKKFADQWRNAQARFVDDPAGAVNEANELVKRLMEARGYPVGDFDQRAADISVDHPLVVQNYRAARDIAIRSSNGQANTEDLRQAMVHYRQLFQDLLATTEPVVTKDSERIEKESVR